MKNKEIVSDWLKRARSNLERVQTGKCSEAILLYSGGRDKIILDTTAEDYKLIYLPPHTAHAIKNVGDSDASVVVFSTMPENPDDTIPYEIEDV